LSSASRAGAGRDDVIRVTGGRPLHGRLCVGGSKNATLPILAACLLTAEPVRVTNLAEVTDTQVMLEILKGLGCDVDLPLVHAADVSGRVSPELARKMRASLVLLGPLLARRGEVRLPRPGGDDIGTRRVEQHIGGLRRLGAVVEETPEEFIASADRLHGARIVLDMPTVTGTENLMMAAVLAKGRTEILNAAREPHVQDLALFLNGLGARVTGAGTDEIVVEGVEALHGGEHSIRPDYLEAGTYAIAVAATGGEIVLECSPSGDLNVPVIKLQQAGVEVDVGELEISIRRPSSSPLRAVDLTTWVHPGFPTDLQAQYMALMTQAEGLSVISEYIFENRFQHVAELVKMGARIESLDGRTKAVHGPSRLRGTDLEVPDIRAGAAMVIAALCAEGESMLHHAWHVDRGYPDMVTRLAELGADIARVTGDGLAQVPRGSFE